MRRLERVVLQGVERLGAAGRRVTGLPGGGGDLLQEGALDLQGAGRAAGRQLAAHPQPGVVGEGVQRADRVGEGDAPGQVARPLGVVLDQ